MKYEALRLLLAGTALTLTAMLFTPGSMMAGNGKVYLEKSVTDSVYNNLKSVPTKKSKSKTWSLASFHERR